MKKVVVVLYMLCIVVMAKAQEPEPESESAAVDSIQMFVDALEKNFRYQEGEIQLGESIGKINVPKGFRFLDTADARTVLEMLWGNPADSSVLGLILPEDMKATGNDTYAFIITFEDMGYVEDDDADDIDYDDLLEEMQTDMKAANESRVAEGYSEITLIGWAATPYYDQDKKVLHWAKELKFGDMEANTLNYNIRVLGRKGVLVFNAVATIDQLPVVKEDIQPLLSSFEFASGSKYSDFDPEIDQVAAWTIGGLVAGKVLAKAGILALLLKNIKLIGLGIVALFGGAVKWFKRKTEPPTVRDISGGSDENKSEPS